jgi:hypothetical protein
MSFDDSYKTPQIVEHHLSVIIGGLEESQFFTDFGINDTFARKVFTQLLMEIYVNDPSMDQQEFFWSEEKFEETLQKIITGSIMYELKEEGILNSYEDENTTETFFLTKKGKGVVKGLKNLP